MTKMVKRIIAVFIAMTMCLTLGLTVSAETTTPTSNTFSINNAESMISGYEQLSISPGTQAMLIYCDIEGNGGMGITVKTSCTETYNVNIQIFSPDYSDPLYKGIMSTNSEIQLHNLYHYTGNPYLVTFDNVGTSFLTQVWIYG